MNRVLPSLAALLLLAPNASRSQETSAPAVIPAPAQMTLSSGAFTLRENTPIFADSSSRETAEMLSVRLRESTGYPFVVKSTRSIEPIDGAILLTTRDPVRTGLEGYHLSVLKNAVVIRSDAPAGLFYGTQTLLQLLPPLIFSNDIVQGVTWRVPCAEIDDSPRFQWRGLMLDVSRHFFTKSEVERLLDAMALHKMNTFHWHLVDDQGWRIEIHKYPRLTQVGAWRHGIHFGLDPKASTAYGPDGRYGGFYTQDDIREVVAYAAARHINIVPEIEMPGHASAALMAYPEFACNAGPFSTDRDGGVFNGIYCAGNDDTFRFVEDVLTEVIALFPGKYIHVGGDEVLTDNWKACPKCQARMKKEGLKQPSELEGYFIRRIETFLNVHDRTLVGWSEIRQGGLAQNAVVMDWIGGAVESAKEGHDVVMTPLKYSYFDHYQSRNQSAEPHAIGGYLPLSQVYAFEPVPADLPATLAPHILGPQANLWTEYIPSFKHAEYMIFPRLSAMAEVGWSPASARDWADFQRRLKVQEERFDLLRINYRHDGAVIE